MKKKVAVIYPYLPHYRIPVFNQLAKSKEFDYVFYYGENKIDPSISSASANKQFNSNNTPSIYSKGLYLQFGLTELVFSKEIDVLIFLGNPAFLTTWLYALLGRLTRKKVIFWTHGWLSDIDSPKSKIKEFFFMIPHMLMLYGNRAKNIGLHKGFKEEKMCVIYNSIDFTKQSEVYDYLETSDNDGADYLPSEIDIHRSYFSCVARLTNKCNFEVLIDAVRLYNNRCNTNCYIVLIGDGPAKTRLEQYAKDKLVELILLGESYDEYLIGTVLYNSRAVVSPGKVGLTAMHSLAYGVPVISHGDLNTQMPESEIIIPNITGDYFDKGNAEELSKVLERWIKKPRILAERYACINLVKKYYTPIEQALLIDKAISKVMQNEK